MYIHAIVYNHLPMFTYTYVNRATYICVVIYVYVFLYTNMHSKSIYIGSAYVDGYTFIEPVI